MEWILYIIGGIILIGILWEIKFIPEFLSMIGIILFSGVISGTVSWIFDWGEFEAGFKVGFFIGVALYAIYCIIRIFSPDTLIIHSNGTQKVISERGEGIVGLIVLIACTLFVIFQ